MGSGPGMTCEGCPLVGKHPQVPGTGAKGGICVVGEAPSSKEVNAGHPFAGFPRRLIDDVLSACGVNVKTSVYYTNAILCATGSGATPELIDECRDRLLNEIREAESKKVLILGNAALRALIPDASAMTNMRGRPLFVDDLGIPAVATYHPLAVLRDGDLLRDFGRDATKLVSIREDLTRDEAYFQVEVPFVDVRTYEDFLAFLNRAQWAMSTKTATFSYDLETRGVEPADGATIISVGIAIDDENVYIFRDEELRKRPFWVAQLRALFRDLRITWVGQNAEQFDAKFLRHAYDIDPITSFDCMLAHYALDERQEGHGLKDMSTIFLDAHDYEKGLKQYLGTIPIAFEAINRKTKTSDDIQLVTWHPTETHEAWEELRTKIAEQKATFAKARSDCRIYERTRPANYDDIPRQVLFQYQALDLYYTRKLYPILRDEMIEDEVDQIHDKILLPAAHALGQVETNGVLVDTEYLKDLAHQYDRQIHESLEKLSQYALSAGMSIPKGEQYAINPNSHLQVKDLLFKRLRVWGGRVGSTDKETMETIKHPAAAMITEYRLLSKLKSTYVEGLLKRRSPDGRVRGDFLLTGTVTGRLSSRNPNLQNIPQVAGPAIRNAFISSPGWTMIEADYSQLELRVAGWYSRDPIIIDAYSNNVDFHKIVAAEVFNVPIEEVTKEQRYIAKYIDFGIIYGRGAKSLAYGELHCSEAEAQKYIDNFLGRFPGLTRWIGDQERRAIANGFVRSSFGRKRRFPLVLDQTAGDIQRQAVNTPIQSMASDICLGALTRLQERLDPTKARILLTVHDSILLECRDDCLRETLDMVWYEMESNLPIESPVPFRADIKIGRRWGSLEELDPMHRDVLPEVHDLTYAKV